MEVLTIESETFQEFKAMYERVSKIAAESSIEVARLKKEHWLTSKQACAYCGFSLSTLEKFSKEIGCSQPGGRDKRYKESDLEKFMMETYYKYKPSHKLKVG